MEGHYRRYWDCSSRGRSAPVTWEFLVDNFPIYRFSHLGFWWKHSRLFTSYFLGWESEYQLQAHPKEKISLPEHWQFHQCSPQETGCRSGCEQSQEFPNEQSYIFTLVFFFFKSDSVSKISFPRRAEMILALIFSKLWNCYSHRKTPIILVQSLPFL